MTQKSKTSRKIALISRQGAFFLGSCLLASCSARPAHAQFLGYTSPQGVQQTLAPALTSCTGGPQFFPVTNLGQTQHTASIVLTNANTTLNMRIQGLDAAGNIFTISDVAYGAGTSGANAIVSASGYYPVIRVLVTCVGGSFTLTYSGTSSAPNLNAGVYLASQIDKAIFAGAAENLTQGSGPIIPPFGTTNGTLVFQYTTAAIAGSTLNVFCVANGVNQAYWFETFSIANSTALQTFQVPPSDCGLVQVNYTTGGGGAGLAALDYLFSPPGMTNPTLGIYTHITGTTATAVKGSTGTLISLTVNTPAAGTISIFDLASAACTGTPATNIVGVITATATAPIATLPYNSGFVNGICVKASVAMDITVISQ